MVDKIDPTNQTSVEYGQSLLGRKFEVAEKEAKDARKDRKINYAMQVLGGVDNLIKDRARRNMAERNSEITQQIIREEAEFNKLQKEYEGQKAWRASNDPYGYATQLAKGDLADVWGQRLAAGASPLSKDEKTEYQNTVKSLADNYYNKYQENKISALPFETKEAYTAELRAMLNKQAPSGLLDIALRGVGFRGNKQAELATKIGDVQDIYKDRLRDRPSVKGSVDNLSEEAKLALIQVPKQDLTPTKTRVQINNKGITRDVIQIQDKVTGDFTFTDLFGEPLSKTDLGMQPSKSYTTNAVNDIAQKYQKDFGPSQIATIHSAIANSNSPHYDLEIADALKFHKIFKHTFNVDAKSPVLDKQFDDQMAKTVEPFKDKKVLEEQTAAKIPEALSYQLSQTSSKENYNLFKTRVVEDSLKIQREGVRDSQGILQPVKEMHAYDASFLYHSQRIKPVTMGEGWFDGKKRTVYEFAYEPMKSGIFDSQLAPPVNRDVNGKPDSIEQVNRDTDELIKSDEFQSKTPTEQKAILQNAADQGADINPEILGPQRPAIDEQVEDLRGPRPEGVQLELTGDDSFDAVRAADEMLLADEGPTVQDAQDFLDREQEMLNPSRPEFKELTREEEKQQSTEQRARDKKERDDRIASNKKEMAYRLSPEGKEEIKQKRKANEKVILNSINEFLDNDPEMNRIKMYAEGTLNKNKKPSSTSPLGKTLVKYELEDMSRLEIKKWLIEQIKTKYSPSDIQDELDKGNPVFVGDYRDVTKK